MVTRVLDTSVVVKWFFNEEGTDRAEALLSELLAGSARIQVPSLLYYELANVVWTRRTPGFSTGAAQGFELLEGTQHGFLPHQNSTNGQFVLGD